MAYTGKPISLHPMEFKDAVSALLKVKPEPRKPKAKKRTIAVSLKGQKKPSE
jgi:hypothetical protein